MYYLNGELRELREGYAGLTWLHANYSNRYNSVSIAAVGGINLQDLQDFCRVSGKEDKNVNCTNMFGLLESFVDALRAEIFQKSNSNFSNWLEH